MTSATIVCPVRGYRREIPDWERRDMTVCIAAVCLRKDGRSPVIVFCTDLQGSTVLGRSETQLKNRPLRPKWRCLTAGTESEILALVHILSGKMRSLEEIDETNVVGVVRDALAERKREKINELTQGRFALSYDNFLKFGKEKLPDDIFRSTMFAISEMSLDAELVIGGFASAHLPMLLQTESKGRVRVREDFAIVGEGAFLAQSALIHRKQSDVDNFDKTVYSIYEAKKHAERVASVGEQTTLCVLESNGRFSFLKTKGKTYLDTQFAKFGPQPISSDVKIESGFFEELVGPVDEPLAD